MRSAAFHITVPKHTRLSENRKRQCNARVQRTNCSLREGSITTQQQLTGQIQRVMQAGLIGLTTLSLNAVMSQACMADDSSQPRPSIAAVEEYLATKGDFFQPMQYIGRWYEVASLKEGFAGQGQQDCHCTQGLYMPKVLSTEKIELEVETFCWHGSPEGRVSGIQGRVTCANPELLALLPEFKTQLEQEEGIKAKCVLRFPSLPFIPPEPYNVIKTDYKSYALVRGSVDRSFVQIYSRTPNPGDEFIQEQKATLAALGYDVDRIVDTPQDCPEVPMDELMEMMKPGTMDFMTNTVDRMGPAPSGSPLTKGIQFSSVVPRNPLTAATDVLNLLKGLVNTK